MSRLVGHLKQKRQHACVEEEGEREGRGGEGRGGEGRGGEVVLLLVVVLS